MPSNLPFSCRKTVTTKHQGATDVRAGTVFHLDQDGQDGITFYWVQNWVATVSEDGEPQLTGKVPDPP